MKKYEYFQHFLFFEVKFNQGCESSSFQLIWKFSCVKISAFSFIFSLFLAFHPDFTVFFLVFAYGLSHLCSINTQCSSRDTLKMMLFTKYLIKWKRIGRINWKFRYWFNLKSSMELDIKRCYTCPMPFNTRDMSDENGWVREIIHFGWLSVQKW